MNNIPDNCPKCGSQSITKLMLHKKKTQKGQSSGCVGCLLVIIIILIAPWLLPILGIGAIAGAGGIGAVVAENKEVFITIGVIALAIWAANAWEMSRTYICEKCGKKFK